MEIFRPSGPLLSKIKTFDKGVAAATNWFCFRERVFILLDHLV